MTPPEELEAFESQYGGWWALWDTWRAAYDRDDQIVRDMSSWRLRRLKKLRAEAEAYTAGLAAAIPLQGAVEFVAGLQLAARYRMHEADAAALEAVIEMSRGLG